MSTKGKEKVSIIMPSYNGEKFLKFSIEGIRNQTYTNFELIIINDGSTDKTDTICRDYCKIDRRIIYLSQKNKGVSQARNYGLEKASGNFITFVDSDDIIHPRFLEILIEAINDNRKDIAGCFFTKTRLENFKIQFKKVQYKKESIIISGISLLKLLLGPSSSKNNNLFPVDTVWGKLYKRNILIGEKFNSLHSEDIEYNSRVYNKINDMVIVPETLYWWIQREESAHRIITSNMADHILCAVQIVENFYLNESPGRTLALKRLILNLLSARYNVKNFIIYNSSKNNTLKLIKNTMKKYKKEFILNNNISLYFRIGSFILYYFPFTYSLLRKLLAFKNRC